VLSFSALPFKSETPIRFFAAKKERQPSRLRLNDGIELQFLSGVFGFALQTLKHAFGDEAAGFGGEQVVFHFDFRAAIEQDEDGAVDDGLAKFFDEIQHERGLAGAVDVEKSGKRLETRGEQRGPDFGVENAVAVIEHGIDRVGRAAMLAAMKHFAAEHEFDGGPILAAGRAFEAHKSVAAVVDFFRLDEPRFVPHAVNGFRVAGDLIAALALGLRHALGKIFEQVGLIGELAGDDGSRQPHAELIVKGFNLRASRHRRRREIRRGEHGIRPAGAVDEGELDAALHGLVDHVAGDGHALFGDDDLLHAKQREFFFAAVALAHDDALGALAAEGAEVGEEEGLGVHG